MDLTFLKSKFVSIFHEKPIIFRAPGRVNIIGEHTDYNDGLVLPFPIQKAIYFATSPRNDHLFHIHALDIEEECILDIHHTNQQPSWTRYFVGAIQALLEDEHAFKGLNIMIQGDIPSGAGISSSSALTCGFIYAIQQLFDLDLSKKEIVFVASRAENGTGVNGGKMDQYAICMGQKGKAILLDCRNYAHQLINISNMHASWFLINTMVEHNLAETGYNNRRADCESAFEIIKEKDDHLLSIRDISLEILHAHSDLLSQKQFERLLHVVKENERVCEMVDVINTQELDQVGSLLFESHYSLSDLYEVSCPELDFIVKYLENFDDCYGARMMGGGFGGSVIGLFKKDEIDFEELKKQYADEFGLQMQILQVESENGISRVN